MIEACTAQRSIVCQKRTAAQVVEYQCPVLIIHQIMTLMSHDYGNMTYKLTSVEVQFMFNVLYLVSLHICITLHFSLGDT